MMLRFTDIQLAFIEHDNIYYFGNFGEVSGNVTGRTGVPPQSLAQAMSAERDLAVVAVFEPTR